jgi:hypothetical protein
MDFVQMFNQSGFFAKLSLLVGFGPLGLAVAYVLRPAERKLALMRPVSLAAIFAAVCGLLAGCIAVLTGIAVTLPEPLNMSSVFAGLSEALVVPFVNFGLLSTSWLVVALGMMRRPRIE